MGRNTTNDREILLTADGRGAVEKAAALDRIVTAELGTLRSRLSAIEASASAAVLAYGAHAHAQLRELFNESRHDATLKALDVLAEAMSKLDIALQAAPAALRVEADRIHADRVRLADELRPLREAMGTQAAADVLAERRRQVEQEGWTHEHDEGHPFGELAEAAACYAAACADPEGSDVPLGRLGVHWPWLACWWKPSKDPRRNLVKAGALILAEIERLDRCRLSDAPQGEVQP